MSLVELARRAASLTGETVIDAHGHLGLFAHFHVARAGAADLVAHMGRYGISLAWISGYAGITSDFVFGNDEVAQAVADFPGRFLGLGIVNPNYAEEMIPELERCERMGVKEIKLIADYQGYDREGPAIRGVCAYAHETKKVILNHNWGSAGHLDGLAGDFPHACLVIGHFSLDYGEVVRRRANVYQCTCAMSDFGALERLLALVPVEKVLYGSDFSYLDAGFGLGPILYARIPDAEKRRILGANAAALMAQWQVSV